MRQKQSASLARGRRVGESVKPISDKKIDFSDIQESSDEELKRARRVGRPKTGDAKQLIALRIRPSLLAALRKKAARRKIPYQTLIHQMLEKATNSAA